MKACGSRKVLGVISEPSPKARSAAGGECQQVGMTGVYGLEGGYHAVAECDTLLLLGCNFAFSQFYPERACILQQLTQH